VSEDRIGPLVRGNHFTTLNGVYSSAASRYLG